MGMRIFWAIILIVLIVGGIYAYQHYQQQKQLADGAVICTGCMTKDEKDRFDKENSGDTPDGQSERKVRTARQEEAAGYPGSLPGSANGQAAAANAANTATPNIVPAGQSAGQTTLQPAGQAPAQPPAPAPGYNTGRVASLLALPVSDSQAANAPNGMRYTGAGQFQWYRQGNLTWRVDTATGGSCIAFATLEEWRKQIVSSHGCGRGV